MPRATVRTAVASWLAPPAVSGVGTVYTARPKLIPATAYDLAAGPGFGAVIVVHLTRSREQREGLGGPESGVKFVTYTCALELLFQSVLATSEAGFAAHDQIVDSLISRIRADRTFATNGNPIWQAGEGRAGIAVDLAEPVLTPQALQIDAVVTFEVREQVTS